jgi:hypothetical protein
MDFKPLKDRLATLPLILAGPIVRRTEPKQVTVWVALKAPRKVTLHIYKKIGEEPLFSSAGETIALGDNLHLLAVTAKAPINALMLWGIPYYYDMDFDSISGDSREDVSLVGNLNTENIFSPVPELKMLTYNDDLLPSFILPAEELSDLRIIHSSCRKPHGEGEDMLAKVDELIDEAVKNPSKIKRPQQLFLTGDQIYADDVAPTMLAMLRDASDALLGWEEKLPGIKTDDERLQTKFGFKLTDQILSEMEKEGQPVELINELKLDNGVKDKRFEKVTTFAKEIRPIVEEAFRSHGISEYGIKKYVSIVIEYAKLSRARLSEKIAKFTAGDVAANHLFTAGEYWMMYLFVWSDVLWDQNAWKKEEFDNETDQRIYNLYKKLPSVRKVLANISTYMICDDHEITDDWFLNLQWCVDVFGSKLGRRILLNGMLGYALFQAWGNDPKQFDEEASGKQFLDAVKKWHPTEGAPGTVETEKMLWLALGIPAPDTSMIEDIKNERSLHVLHTKSQKMALNWHYHVPGSKHQVIVLDTRTWRYFPGDPVEDDADELEDGNNAPALLGKEALIAQILPYKSTDNPFEITFVVSAAPVIPVEHLSELRSGIGLFGSGGKIMADYEDWEYQKEAVWLFYATLSAIGRVSELSEGNPYLSRIVFLSGDVHYGYASKIDYERTALSSLSDFPDLFGLKKGATAVFVQLNSSGLKNQDKLTKYAQSLGYKQRKKTILPFKHRETNASYKYIEHILANYVEWDPLNCSEDLNWMQMISCIASNTWESSFYDEIIGRNNIGEVYFESNNKKLSQKLYWKDDDNKNRSSHYIIELDFNPA